MAMFNDPVQVNPWPIFAQPNSFKPLFAQFRKHWIHPKATPTE